MADSVATTTATTTKQANKLPQLNKSTNKMKARKINTKRTYTKHQDYTIPQKQQQQHNTHHTQQKNTQQQIKQKHTDPTGENNTTNTNLDRSVCAVAIYTEVLL